jgi:hypothetical protein
MKPRGVFAAVIAVASGMLVLAGIFFGKRADGSLSSIGQVQVLVISVAVILAGFAVLMGIINLLMVHLNKLRSKQKGSFYSVLLIISLLGTFSLGLAAHYLPLAGSIFTGIFNAVQVPVETSLMAILSVTLVYASIRLLRRKLTLFSIVFLATALLVLIGSVPLPFLGSIPILGDAFHSFITRVLATAGARGLLIGVALGTLTTGLRILMGADRPFWGR